MNKNTVNGARGGIKRSAGARRVFQAVVVSAFVAAGALSAHAATLVAGEATGVPGQAQVALPLTLTVASGEQLSAILFDVQFDPLAAQWQSANLNPVVTSLGKQVETHLIDPGHLRVVIYGQNQQTLVGGEIVSLVLQVPASAVPGSSLVSLTFGEASDPTGAGLPLTLSDGRLWIEAPPVVLDTTAPVLTVATPSAGSHILQGTAVTVSGTVTDDSADPTVTVDAAAVTVGLGGAFSYTANSLPVGDHTFIVNAIDAAGNSTSQSRTITVDPVSNVQTVLSANQTTARSNGWLLTNGTDEWYWSAGEWLEYQIDFGSGGNWTFGVTAMNKNSNTSPGLPSGYAFNFAVTLDGAAAGSVAVPGSSTMYKLGTSVIGAPKGKHTVRFTWTNDAYSAGAYDANVQVSQVSFTPPGGTPPAPPADTTAPVISALSVANLTTSSAQLLWATDELATSWVEYGVTTAYGMASTLDSTLVAAHGVTVSGLTAGTAYHARVRSKDAAGNEAVGPDQTFTTAAAAVVVSGPTVTIKKPVDGSVVTGSTQTLLFSVTGAKLGINAYHVHIILDNGSVWHVYSTDPFYLKNLSLGKHKLTIQLVDKYHQAVSGPGALAATTFTVQ